MTLTFDGSSGNYLISSKENLLVLVGEMLPFLIVNR
jgi:hypothetical protein